MTELIKCSGCASRKLPEFYTIKPTTGQRLKTCNDCRERLKLRPKPSPKSNSSSEFCCNQCQKKLSSNQRLLLHIKSVHDKIQDFACIHCEQKFSERGNLQLHVKAVHDKIRDHQCTQCDVQFSYRWLLNLHIKSIHDQIRDEECPTCDFKTSGIGNLREHLKVCTGGERMSSGEYAVKGVLETMRIPFHQEMRFSDAATSRCCLLTSTFHCWR